MNFRQGSPKSIALVDIQEEPLPSGRKLLHCIFKSKFANEFYRWTPPWRQRGGDHGVERLFFKALEVEEWNDPEGVWDQELKKAAAEIPPLRDLKLPVRIECSGLTALSEENWAYRIDVSIMADEDRVTYDDRSDLVRVGNIAIRYERFKTAFTEQFNAKWGLGINKSPERLWEGDWDQIEVGIKFGVWVPQTLEREALRVLGREVAHFVRAFLRNILSDYEAFKKAFEG